MCIRDRLRLYAYVIGQSYGVQVYLLIEFAVERDACRSAARIRTAEQQKSSDAQNKERGEQNYPKLRLTPHTAILEYPPPVVNRAAK